MRRPRLQLDLGLGSPWTRKTRRGKPGSPGFRRPRSPPASRAARARRRGPRSRRSSAPGSGRRGPAPSRLHGRRPVWRRPPSVPSPWSPTNRIMAGGSSMRSRRWPTTRPPVSVPFEATIMYGRGARAMAWDSWSSSRSSGGGSRAVCRRPRSTFRGLLVVVLRVLAVDVGRLARHRRVQVEGQGRDRAGRCHPIQLPDQLLGPPDGEGRHEQDTVVLGDQPDDSARTRRASAWGSCSRPP